jgi:hypothetical protein
MLGVLVDIGNRSRCIGSETTYMRVWRGVPVEQNGWECDFRRNSRSAGIPKNPSSRRACDVSTKTPKPPAIAGSSLWLACHTREEIAAAVGSTRDEVRGALEDCGEFGKLAENPKAMASHAVDFEVPLCLSNGC